MTGQEGGGHIADLSSLPGGRLAKRPWVHRVLLENLLRHSSRDPHSAAALDSWLRGGAPELPFYPARLMMHDTTCGPALVDLAAMRSVVAEAGGDPRRISPRIPVHVSTDHSLAVDHFGTAEARERNLAIEMQRNAERFRFMKWAESAFDHFHVYPPGSGIMHTINLERLATVVTEADGWIFPDTLIGTDSHTPMINGIGVFAWGVGGLEAESAMLGLPVMLKVPSVVGVRLSGCLRPGILATDLALAITSRLRKEGIDGRFVEFFGPGVSALSAGTRAVVANMTPEFGGATGFFAPDDQVLAYLRATGRSEALVHRVQQYAFRQQLWFDPAVEPEYDAVVRFDLDAVRPGIAGPHRPQDLLPRSTEAEKGGRQPIAIASITSCTNTSDPRLLLAAGLLARAAADRGLVVPGWVKTSLAPGSPTAEMLLRRAGLLSALEALGFAIVGYGCTTCIGNSGPLTADMQALLAAGEGNPVAILSGNRNFPGRIHRGITDSYLTSPPMVIAWALAGHFGQDIERDPIAIGKDGAAVYLADLWPSDAEIDQLLAVATSARDYDEAYAAAANSAPWNALEAPEGPLYPWGERSTYLRRPPFVTASSQSLLGHYHAFPILVVGDDVTTDHISPAGTIPADSEAGEWLLAHGEAAADLNVYSARRGNWEVMLRGLFTNPSVRNLLSRGLFSPESSLPLAPGFTIHGPTGQILPLWKAAERYRRAGHSVVVVAGERFGMGSSRDWAAKGQFLLGARAVLARSFERIHRTNLINMGVLPLQLSGEGMAGLRLAATDQIEINVPADRLVPSMECRVLLRDSAGRMRAFEARAAVETEAESSVLRHGGMIPFLVESNIK